MSIDHRGLIEIPASKLEPGMYVAEIDRPWLETPFATQGFYVRSAEDTAYVQQHCDYVFVDPRRRRPPSTMQTAATTAQRQHYRNHTDLDREIATAKDDLESASEAVAKVFGQLRTNGHLDVPGMQRAINPLIDSVLRNDEALAALIRMRSRGDYFYNRALSNAVWAALLGRHIGLELATLKRLALGAALVDVGMSKVDSSITDSDQPLTDEQLVQMREHVLHGMELLKQAGNVDRDVLQIIANHHERYDGSGYPRGLIQDEIPLLARIVGLVDTYDAMITDKPWAPGRSSFNAMQELADAKDELFQGALVEQFLQAVGLFPTGSIVELSSGEVGIVLQQNPTRRLRPKLTLILDADKRPLDEMVIIDLGSYAKEDGNSAALWITQELRPGDYGIQPDEYFL